MRAILDRYLLRNGLAGLVIILGIVVLVVLGLDLLLNLNGLLRGELEPDRSRMLLILRFVLYQAPAVISPMLPVVTLTAAMITAGPMLRRGEYIALAASGISLRRSARPLLALALLVGIGDFLLVDRLAPRFEPERAAIEDALTGTPRGARSWQVPATGASWFAGKVNLAQARAPRMGRVLVAPRDGALLQAAALEWNGSAWLLRAPVISGGPGPQRSVSGDVPCTGQLALPFGPAELARRLASHQAKGLGALWRSGSPQQRALAWQRLARVLAPLLAVLLALPGFVRFANRDHLLLAGVRCQIVGLVPLTLLALGGWVGEAGSWPPGAVMLTAVVIALLPGIHVFRRWQL